jgi:hypothetical protein
VAVFGIHPLRAIEKDALLQRATSFVPKTLRHRLHLALIESPVLRALYVRCRRKLRPLAPNQRTVLVVEGFPRSANTYVVAALYEANPQLHGLVAHHLHSYRSVIEGTRRRLPVVVLVRAPLDAVASLIQRYPDLSVRLALRQYVAFHRRLLPFLPSLIVIPFDRATAHFDTVIEEINERTRLDLAPHDGSSRMESRVLRRIEQMEREDADEHTLRENAVARPSPVRLATREAVHEQIRQRRRLLQRAEAVYALITARAAADSVAFDKAPRIVS